MPQRIAEVIMNSFWVAPVVGKRERKGLLPWKLGGEAASETACVATALAMFSQNPLLFGERQIKEAAHVVMGVWYKRLGDAMIDHEEEAVLITRLGYETGSF